MRVVQSFAKQHSFVFAVACVAVATALFVPRAGAVRQGAVGFVVPAYCGIGCRQVATGVCPGDAAAQALGKRSQYGGASLAATAMPGASTSGIA